MRRVAIAATALGLLGGALVVSACAQPAATAAAAAARCPRIIGNTGGGRPVTLVDHTCATLRLGGGGGLIWSTPRSSNRHVRVGRAVGPAAWHLTAASRGTATVTSVGRPNCAAGRACPAYAVAFSRQIHVVAKAR